METLLGQIPARIREPSNYYRGLVLGQRLRLQNLLVFQRLSYRDLKQHRIESKVHHRYALCCVLEGAGEVRLGEKTLRLVPGEVLLIPPYQFHDYPRVDADSLRWLFITFQVLEGSVVLDELAGRPTPLGEPSQRLLSDVVCAWGRGVQVSAEGLFLDFERFLIGLWLERKEALSGSSASVLSVGPEDSGSWGQAACRLIVQSVHEGGGLDGVAAQLNVSPRMMRKRFNASVGVSPREYRANYQTQLAVELLSDLNISVGRIAERCGFESLPAFSRFLKRQLGHSPIKLRDRLLAGESIGAPAIMLHRGT